MQIFKSTSINGKLTRLVATAVATALAFAYAAFVINDVRTARKSLIEQMSALADVLADNAAAALTFDDAPAAQKILESLELEPPVESASIFDADGKLFAAYERSTSLSPQSPREPLAKGIHFDADGHLNVTTPILVDGERIGAFDLHASMDHLYQQLYNYSLSMGLVLNRSANWPPKMPTKSTRPCGSVDVDLNEAIRSTVIVSRNRWKYAAELDLERDLSLPMVKCLSAEINLALLNLVVIAADAIADRLGDEPDSKGRIVVRSKCEAGKAIVEIEDNRCGIPETIRNRIFDPFFTTKEVGNGSGQGLAISRDIVVNKHQGTIRVESTPGKGTKFVVRLPLGEEAKMAGNDDAGMPAIVEFVGNAIDAEDLIC